MTKREKEIFKEAWKYFHDTSKKLDMVKCSPMGDWTDGLVRGFIKGAKWADKTIIDKACKWLKENYYNSEYTNDTWENIQIKFINDFSKAMEE